MLAELFLSPSAKAVQMHIPDGFTSILVSVLFWLLAIIGVGYALRQSGRELGEREVPLMGVLAAAIFAGQMLNFPVAGGTSGHLVGGALAAILLGPWSGILVVTSVVAIQALIFQDGGLLAMGANIFNMAIVGSLVGYATYRAAYRLVGERSWGQRAAGFAAAWLSIVIMSLVAALQLAISGTFPANVSIPAMGGIHALIGIGEGLITVGALALVRASRPDILQDVSGEPAGNRAVVIVGLAIAALLAVISPLASAHPDGLEWVAEKNGFLDLGRDAPYNIIPDYVLPGISSEALATILAGVVGLLIVFAVSVTIAYLRRSRKVVAS